MFALTELKDRLASGRAGLPEEIRSRAASYLRALQQPDGGFPNRQGSSDPYYTAFGLGALALTGELDEAVSARAATFLQHRLRQPALPVEFVAAAASVLILQAIGVDARLASLSADLREQAVAVFAPLRRPDGGYAKNANSRASSTYHTFLVVSCKQLLGIADDEPRLLAALLCSRQRPDGGFVEVPDARSSGVNPTAAAVALTRVVQTLTWSSAESDVLAQELSLPPLEPAARYLAAMQTPEGGLRASALVPVADLLSTFTGLVALGSLASVALIDHQAMQRYVASLEVASGGFRGGSWDAQADCEYTFYGLGTLVLLHGAS